MRRVSIPFFACALLYLTLPMAAMGEAAFGCMDVAAHITRHIEATPEQLRPYVQPVGQTWEEGALRMHVIDAYCVDGMVGAAWTLENTGDVPLYIVDEMTLGDRWVGGHVFHGLGSTLAPGETRQCGYAGDMELESFADLQGNTQVLAINVAGLRLHGETIDWGEVGDGTLYASDRVAYNREVERLFTEEGTIVVEGGGYISPVEGEATADQDVGTLPLITYGYTGSGMMSLDSHIHAEMPVRMDHATVSILPAGDAGGISRGWWRDAPDPGGPFPGPADGRGGISFCRQGGCACVSRPGEG